MRISKWETAFIILLVAMFLTGLSLALYPTVQGFLVDSWISSEAKDFLNHFGKEPEESISLIDPAETEPQTEVPTEPKPYQQLWDDMVAYNEHIYQQGQADLSDNTAYQTPSFFLRQYGVEQETFGVITIPKLELTMPIFLGATDYNMAMGAAVLSQTSIPIGGKNTNSIIAGHRGYNGASYFRYITDLSIGDRVIITNLWEELTYEVCETRIVEPSAIDEILIQEGRDLITLLTCHPYASGGRQRFLVFCERCEES